MIGKRLAANNLIEIFRNVENEDSYSVSPVYYLMTGRKGGMIFDDSQQCIIVVNHPNLDNCVLVFPAIPILNNRLDLSLEFEIARKIMTERPASKVKIARVPVLIAQKYPHAAIEEDLLDWRFPVHILDVEGVSFLKGKGYQQVRQRINSLNVDVCVVKPIDVHKDRNIILNMTLKWAREFPYAQYSSDDLILPTKTLLRLMENSELNIFGQIIYYNGVASSYCIWEERNHIANAYSMSADRSISGLAEYNIIMMCRHLYSKGIINVNIGGSESEGLNRYKKKFSPIQSISLKSCVVI